VLGGSVFTLLRVALTIMARGGWEGRALIFKQTENSRALPGESCQIVLAARTHRSRRG